MNFKKILSVMLALCTAVSLAACGTSTGTSAPSGGASAPAPAPANKEILIGALCSLSKETVAGEAYRNAFQLAVDEINAAGGILGGSQLRLIAEDGATDTDTAINACNKLIEKEKVNVILGPAFSTQGLAIEELCQKAQVPLIVTGTSPKFSECENPYLFRGRSSDSIMGGLAMTFIFQNLKLGEGTTVGMLYNNNDFGVGGFNVVSKYAEENGLKIVSESYNTDDTDVSAQVASLKSANCDVIVVWSSGGAVAVAARALYEQGVSCPIVGSAACGQNSVLSTASQWVENWYVVSDCVLTKEDEKIQKFVSDYTAKYGADVLTYESAVAYSMVYLVRDAYERAGSSDKAAFLDALSKTSDTEVLVGTYHKYDEVELFSGGAIGQIKNGAVQYISDVDTMLK